MMIYCAEYTFTDSEGRVGTNKIYIQFNEEGEPEYNWSTSDLSAEINFGTATLERTSTTLTYTSEGQYEYKSKSATINLLNNNSRTLTTELIGIPDTQSILSFEFRTTGSYTLQYEILDAANRQVTIGDSTTNSVKTNIEGSVIEVKGLTPGNYKIKLSNLESKVNSTYEVHNIVVRHNKYTSGAVTGNIKSNDSISNNLALVFAGTMIDGAKTIDGQYGSITIMPDGTFTYNTNYSRRVDLGSLFNQNVDFYPITGYLGQTEVFNYYYKKPNGEQIPAKLEIYLEGAAREFPFKTNTINLTANNTVATAADAPLAYTVSTKTDAASTINFEE